MTPFLGETEIKEASPETLSDVLSRMDQRQAGDAVTLKKIEQNTHILKDLLKGGTTSNRFASKVIAKGLNQADAKERPRDAQGRFAPAEEHARARKVAQEAVQSIERQRARTAPKAIDPANNPSPAERVPETATRAASPRRSVLMSEVRAQRDRSGRFTRNPQSNPQTPEHNPQTLAAIFAKALKGKYGENKGDLKDAMGRAALGGAGWEAAQQAMEAFSSAKESLNKEEGLLHDLKGWGKGKLKRDPQAVTERTEQVRHRELIQAVHEIHPGEGDSGVADAIGGAVGAGAGGGIFKRVLSKVPGAGVAGKILSKAGPILGMLTSGTVMAGLVAAGSVLAAGKSLFFGGSNPINDLFNRLTGGGFSKETPADRGKADADAVARMERTNAERRAQGKRELEYDHTTGVVLPSRPGVTTVKTPDGAIVERTGDRNQRNNNPSNIEAGAFAKSQGAIGTDGRFAVFPSKEAGRKAQRELLFSRNGNLTLTDTIAKLSPPSENDTAAYQRQVLAKVGGKNKKMSQYTPAEQEMIMQAVTAKEGSRKGSERVIKPARPPQMTPLEAEILKVPPAQPMTATVPGMETLVATMAQQQSPRMQEKKGGKGEKIPLHYDDTTLTLMAYDRI